MDLSSAEFSEPSRHLQQRPGCGDLATRNARTAAWSRRAKPRCRHSPRVGRVSVEAEAQRAAPERRGGVPTCVQDRAGGDRLEAARIALQVWPLTRLAEVQESGSASREARGRGGLGSMRPVQNEEAP